MDSLSNLRDALAAIGEDLGLDLDLPDDGACVLETGDGDEILVHAPDDDGSVRLSVPLLSPAEDERAHLYREALLINDDLSLTGTARIGLSDEGEMLSLTHGMTESEIDPARLWAVIEACLLLAREIRTHLRGGRPLTEPQAEDGGAEGPRDAPKPSLLA